ncbi:BTAD domain-containing putative transcriptional regulator [Lysobacter korlensis]|uniref:BTAD domain-containing putative transcriptional regulator n=1 Tax=Lysobacter korlensis TaxID=553636 RepID=A0ABV6S082_9GAMM
MTTEDHSARVPAMEFRLLGPFEVLVDGATVPIGGQAERSLLALLLLHPGEAQSTSRLIEQLWGDDSAPVDPVNAVQIRVSKLRRALSRLGPTPPALVTSAGGYRLEVDPDAVDVHRFLKDVADARNESDPAASESRLAAALELWRGAPLIDFLDEPWATAEADRLKEVRLAAAEERIGAALRGGRARSVLDEVRRLVDANPLHEALAGLLIWALYLLGRQADALAAYQLIRERLDEELGLEPSTALRELEARVLRQDPALGTPETPDATWKAGPATSTDSRSIAATTPPHPHSAYRGPRRLPNRLTSFVGREAELLRLAELVPHRRLVTLLGPGGAGKTSLAIELARTVASRFADGVRLVELSHVSDPADLAPRVAEALGISPELDPGEQLVDRILGYASERSMLVLLDNCEHLIARCAELTAALLQETPDVAIVATSREPLGVPGEVLYRVEPLKTPATAGGSDETLLSFPAVRLFVDRMSSANPQAADEPLELEVVARISRELDGLPLAIELAAARTSTMSVQEIADRLADRFGFLSSGPRTADERQRTLRAAVDWSHDSLPAIERVLLRRLAVFRGGWSASGAEHVATGQQLTAEAVPDALANLVDRSLVQRSAGPQTRYSLLETVRAYALERLIEAGEREAVEARHRRWILDLSVESERGLRGPAQRAWLDRMQAELDNIRSALNWATQDVGERGDYGCALAGALGWFFHLGRHIEGREILGRLAGARVETTAANAAYLQARAVLERPGASVVHPDAACGRFAAESAALFEQVGDTYHASLSRALEAVEAVQSMPRARAEALLANAAGAFAGLPDEWGVAFTHLVGLAIEIAHGGLETVRRSGEETAARFRRLGDDWGLAAVLYQLGIAYRQAGEHQDAIAAFQEAAAVARRLGLSSVVQGALSGAGVCAVGLDRFELASGFFGEAARTQTEQGDPGGKAQAAHGAGLIARARGDYAAALNWFTAALEGFREMRAPLSAAAALSGIGRCQLSFGRVAEAERAYAELEQIAERGNDPLIEAWACEAKAQFLAHAGNASEALQMIERAKAIRTQARRPGLAFEEREVAALLGSLRAGANA